MNARLSNMENGVANDPSEESPLLSCEITRQPGRHQASLIYTMIFIYAVGTALQALPRFQRFRDTICSDFYSGNRNETSQANCKVDGVQNALLWLTGLQKSFGMVVGEKIIQQQPMFKNLPDF